MPNGSFCLVLHGHLPWVLNHGRWPHGEVWLFEAAAETYLPLLELVKTGIAPITLGLMPVLLEQLRSPTFTDGFDAWLAEQQGRAERDEADFTQRGELHLAWLAKLWNAHFGDLRRRFDEIGRDIPGAFAEQARLGHVELLTSNATHGYMPLIQHDACSRAQVRAGVRTSERVLGYRPRGAWLPECAYRPGGPWTSPVLGRPFEYRAGVEDVFANEGVRFFFVDAHLLKESRSEGVIGPTGAFSKVDWEQARWDDKRGWRNVLEPHLVSSNGGPGRLAVLARHPEVSEQVWSGEVGYPGDGRYLEFHKRHHGDGLRYWKVTQPKSDLGMKQAYVPGDVDGAVYTHAQHFVATVRAILARHKQQTGREGIVCAPFDAELFGHWWFEGPSFLKEVFLALRAAGDVAPRTVSQALEVSPPDKVVRLPEGSWGEGGDHRVWLNDHLKWMWEAEHRAEDRFLEALGKHPWRDREDVAEALKAAARELLLLQASDWQFVIHTGGAVDYGYRRFCEHLARFDRACTIADARALNLPETPIQRSEMEEIRLHDPCFADVELRWWVDA